MLVKSSCRVKVRANTVEMKSRRAAKDLSWKKALMEAQALNPAAAEPLQDGGEVHGRPVALSA